MCSLCLINVFSSESTNVLKLCIPAYIMHDQELKGRKEVDTLRVTLLGFSLISVIIPSLSVFYVFMHSAVNYEGFLSDTSDVSLALLSVFKVLLFVVLILPQAVSLLVWLATPTFIKRWYNLQALPPEYTHIRDLAQEIASRMGISPPKILYTQKEVVNCFNVGRTERESTLVVSKWLTDNLNSDELKAVLTHEMAHTKNRDVTLMAYFSAVKRIIFFLPPTLLLSLICIPLYFDVSPLMYLDFRFFLLWIFFGYLTFVCTLLIFGIQWFSRLREVAADARVSLLIDKNILKRTLYKLACVRSIRMLFVSSSLMISGTRKGGILSTHPPLHERYLNLDKERFIIDTSKPPSLKFCFTAALSIFTFVMFITYLFSLYFFITIKVPPSFGPILFPVITAGVLFSHYHYLSIKYIGIIIFLITIISSTFFFGLMEYAYWSQFFFSPPGYLPPEDTIPINDIVPKNVDFAATMNYFLQQRTLFAIFTFLITGSLRLVKKYTIHSTKGI